MPRCKKRGCQSACYLEGFLRPNETTGGKRYPAFFLYVAKRVKCYIPGLGIWRKKVFVTFVIMLI